MHLTGLIVRSRKLEVSAGFRSTERRYLEANSGAANLKVCTGRSRYGARPYAGSMGAARHRREGQRPDTDTHSHGHASGVTNADAHGYPHRYTRGYRYADRHA